MIGASCIVRLNSVVGASCVVRLNSVVWVVFSGLDQSEKHTE